jgi:hypothetical protein
MDKKKIQKKKEMSDGQAIAVSVLLIGAGAAAAIYALVLLFNYFFPGF